MIGVWNVDLRSALRAPAPVSGNNSATERLSFKIRGGLLREMSNPAQGQDCVGIHCGMVATLFSGPAARGEATNLNMAYAMYGHWYIMIAPTPRNALVRLQGALKIVRPLPHSDGVVVVYASVIDHYWLSHGHEHSARRRIPRG